MISKLLEGIVIRCLSSYLDNHTLPWYNVYFGYMITLSVYYYTIAAFMILFCIPYSNSGRLKFLKETAHSLDCIKYKLRVSSKINLLGGEPVACSRHVGMFSRSTGIWGPCPQRNFTTVANMCLFSSLLINFVRGGKLDEARPDDYVLQWFPFMLKMFIIRILPALA